MATAIRFYQTGGPEVLVADTIDVPAPGPGQLALRQTVIGVNFIDIYVREGLYPVSTLPSGIGNEAAGVVTAIGSGVTGFEIGDRVAYGTDGPGSYASERLVNAALVLNLPDNISDHTAAAMMLRGLTAQYLIRRTFHVKPGQFVLFHAAAGGVGLITCQWLKHIGARVIGTVSSPEKAELARANGCEFTIDYTRESFKDRVKEITNGQGVPVVYDGVGKTVFDDSLDCLSRLGMMVSFGNASGPVPPVSPLTLSRKGSLFLTRPSLAHYAATRPELESMAADLFEVVGSGAVKIDIGQRFPLVNAADAQIALAGRKTTGSTILEV